jgi:hypothetical protein
MTWAQGGFNGASPVIDYRIYIDQGTGVWNELAIDVTVHNYIASGLTSDTIYKFRVEARNLIGYSASSIELSIRAAAVPDTPVAPVTTQSLDDLQVSWTAVYNGGSPLTKYSIWILSTDETPTFYEQLDYCNGVDPIVIDATKCTVPIAVLRASPFNLDWGSSIVAKITAQNVVGTSIESPQGNGAVIIVFADAPVNLAND